MIHTIEISDSPAIADFEELNIRLKMMVDCNYTVVNVLLNLLYIYSDDTKPKITNNKTITVVLNISNFNKLKI